MSLPPIVSREQWLAARKQLLAREKELTRARDALNGERWRLGMVEIHKPYPFEGPQGEVGLLDLFDGCRQLVVQHFMFDPEWTDVAAMSGARPQQSSQCSSSNETSSAERVAAVADRGRCIGERVDGDPGQPPARANPVARLP